MAGNTIQVRLEANHVSNALRKIVASSEGFEIQGPAEKGRPDLLIVELGLEMGCSSTISNLSFHGMQ